MHITLSQEEEAVLFRQAAHTASDGGFQSFLVSLQRKFERNSRRLTLTPKDLERIPRYAFDYGNGGWENRLIAIFGRHLGPNLGRP